MVGRGDVNLNPTLKTLRTAELLQTRYTFHSSSLPLFISLQ